MRYIDSYEIEVQDDRWPVESGVGHVYPQVPMEDRPPLVLPRTGPPAADRQQRGR